MPCLRNTKVSKIHRLQVIVMLEGGFNTLLKVIVKYQPVSNTTEVKLINRNKYEIDKGRYRVMAAGLNVID